MLEAVLKQKNISKYELSKRSGIPYTTIYDICSGKASLKECNAETVYKISRALHISMDNLMESVLEERCDPELFKSHIGHKLKSLGDQRFLLWLIKKDKIRDYFNKEWFFESFYLLAMADYISRENNMPKLTAYDDIRQYRFSSPIYSSSVIALCVLYGDDSAKEDAVKDAIPEFLAFNIVEGDVRNVV